MKRSNGLFTDKYLASLLFVFLVLLILYVWRGGENSTFLNWMLSGAFTALLNCLTQAFNRRNEYFQSRVQRESQEPRDQKIEHKTGT